jgi:hypothetical protein
MAFAKMGARGGFGSAGVLGTAGCPAAPMLLGSEQILNGSPTVNTDNWAVLNGATLSVSANGLKVTSGGGASDTAYQALALTVGKVYRLSYSFTFSTVILASLVWDDAFGNDAPPVASSASADVETYFTAGGTSGTTYLLFQPGAAAGEFVEVTNISVKEVLPISPVRCLWGEGDSFMAGAYAAPLMTTVAGVTGRSVSSTGAGSSTIQGIRDRIIANPALRNRVLIVWDGSENGYTTAAAYCDDLNTGLISLGHSRFILIPASVPYGGSTVNPLAIRSEMLTRWPNNVLDWRDWIPNTAGVVNQDQMGDPGNSPTDPHLSQGAMDLIAAGIADFIAGKGW